jgi:ABC-type transport system involved in multi-copper enzyme maturation permease subunit
MSAITAGEVAARPIAGVARPSFWGLMRGEWLKISRQWTFWIMVALVIGGYTLYVLIALSQSADLKDSVVHQPLDALAVITQAPLFLLRIFWGMMLIILTARLIGMEYSGGTVRVILARGVGRLQLLFTQLSVMALIALAGALVFLVYVGALEVGAIEAVVGNLDVFKAADATFWADTRAYVFATLISLGVSILMAAAVTALVRSLAAGLTIAVIWFPVDNLSIILLFLGYRLTHWDFWFLLSGDLLGLNLNAMPNLVMSHNTPVIRTQFAPLTPVTGAHTLLVAAIYAAVFTVVAVGLTATRDVKE